MKKTSLIVSIFLVFAFVLSACGNDSSTMQSDSSKATKKTKTDGIPTNKLTSDEKVALAFIKGYDNSDEAKQKEAIDKYSSDDIKPLLKLSIGSLSHQWSDFKVIESIKKTDDKGEKGTLVLLHITDENGDLHERIEAVQNEKVVFPFSPETTDSDMQKQYNAMRAYFKTPIPDKIKQQQKAEADKKANIEVVKQVSTAWDSYGTKFINSSAVIKNTGNSPASIGNIQVNMMAKDGSIIGTTTATNATPDILLPGETAFIEAIDSPESLSNTSNFDKSTYNIDFSKTTESPTILQTTNVKLIPVNDDYGLAPYKVTGLVENNTSDKVDNVYVSAALYDSSGNLLGVTDTMIDVSINPGGHAGFELSEVPLPSSIAGKVKNIEVKASNYSF